VVTLGLCYLAFFFGQTRCDAENTESIPNHPATCTLSDHQPILRVAVYLSLAIFLCSLTRLPQRALVALGGLVTLAYVGWAISVWVTGMT
jgi:hypothetical protein